MVTAARPVWISCVLAAGGVAAMSVAAWISGLPAVVPSLAPSLLGAAAAPSQREHAPATVLAGHAIAIVATVATLAGMLLARRFHPAAGATTLLVGMGIIRPGGDLVVLIAVTGWIAGIVALFPWATARLTGRTTKTKAARPAPRRRPARA